jgi:transposase
MKVLQIIGADLSKKTIDFATPQGEHFKVNNDPPGYQELMKWIKKQRFNIPEVMIVMEHTGLYSYRLEQYLYAQHVSFAKVPAMAIKHSLGIVRGKNDKIDAKRIARYGFEKQASLVAEGPVDKILERLRMLHSTRDRVVRTRASILRAVKEYQQTYGLKKSDLIISSQLRIIKCMTDEIAKLDHDIAKIVNSEPSLKKNNEL